MIEVKDLKKSYGKTHALRGVSATLHPGKITGLLGPNGCGKSTFIKCILGLVAPNEGTIHVQGTPIDPHGTYRAQVAYVPQNSQFPAHLSAKELFSWVEDLRGASLAEKRQPLIEAFQLQRHLDQPVGALSGGTRQKVSLVLALMTNAPVLILDEPTVGLDPLAASVLKKALQLEAAAGKTVLLVTHMLAEIEQIVQEMHFLLDGKMIYSGSPQTLRSTSGCATLEEALIKLMRTSR